MAPAASNNVRQRRASVWIADGRIDDYRGLVQSLRGSPMTIRLFATGRDLLRALRAAPPDACLVHVRLPDQSGFDLIEMLRPFPAGTLVGMFADAYRVEDEVRALSLGVHLYTGKPLEAEVLLEWHRSRQPARRLVPEPNVSFCVFRAERERAIRGYLGVARVGR
jgi:two-component system, NtrC family, response regulator AtoC